MECDKEKEIITIFNLGLGQEVIDHIMENEGQFKMGVLFDFNLGSAQNKNCLEIENY